MQINFGPLQIALNIAIRHPGEVVILGGEFEEPFGVDGGDGADVMLGGEDEFVVSDPDGVMGKDRGGVKTDGLFIFDSFVCSIRTFLPGCLHEKTSQEGTSNCS